MSVEISFTILGSGTSTGVPMLACRCETCMSSDSRDKRLRASALLRWPGSTVVIDTTPEFRIQMLRAGAQSLDAVLLTHNHADHVNGLDDLRQFTFGSKRRIPVYGHPQTMGWVRHHFDYVWEATQVGGGLPKIDLIKVEAPFVVNGVRFTPIPVQHGVLTVYGYRVGDVAYISDVSAIPRESMSLLAGLDTLFLDAVRYRPHSTHFHVATAVEAAQRIGARQTYLTHLNHDLMHRSLEKELPAGIAPAHDGLVVRATAQTEPPGSPGVTPRGDE